MYYSNYYCPYNDVQQVSSMQPMQTTGMGPPQAQFDTGIFVYPNNLNEALMLIQQALMGESEDRQFYTYLLGEAPSAEDRQIITGIRDNEIGHFSLFRQLYFELTGNMPPVMQGEEFAPPASYCDGLRDALMGETNAVQNYRKILYAMQNRIHINMLTEIMTDEIRHGILYSYLYAKNGCHS